MHRPTVFQRLLSYLTPVRLHMTSSAENAVLELLYYRGQYQLATADALYSDGDRYRPVNSFCKHIRTYLPEVKNVLVLGTGLGSAVQVFTKRGCFPDFTLVDHDDVILLWASKLLEAKEDQKIIPIQAKAEQFITTTQGKFDVIFIDIFKSRVAPDFVTSKEFLSQCKGRTNAGGYVGLNYIVQKNDDWTEIEERIRDVFPNAFYIKDGINRIVVAKV